MVEIRMAQGQPDEMIVEGYALVFDAPTVLFEAGGIAYKEVIKRNALNETNFKDCCLRYNHSDTVPILARTRGGSLSLTIDDKGLFFRAKLFDTQASRDVYSLVNGGALDKCSFAFIIDKNGDEYNAKTRTRTINSISKILDCSIVDNPAYDQTSVNARSFFETQKELEDIAKQEQERLRHKLLIATYL